MLKRFSETIQQVSQVCPDWLRGRTAALHVPRDLEVDQAGVEFVAGRDQMDYLWFRVTEHEGGQAYPGYRVVRLLQLRYIPLEARGDAGLLQKMRTALRGMYSAGVNLVYLAAGIFSGESPAGIVQCYGVTAFDPELEAAKTKSLKDLVALRSTLTGAYRQLRLEPINVRIADWIFSAFQRMPHALVVVGHPDPRENARGGERSVGEPIGDVDPSAQHYSLQQNELLFRGMSELREDFLFVTLTSPLSIPVIVRMLTGLAEETSTWASLQQGVRGAAFGVSAAGGAGRQRGQPGLALVCGKQRRVLHPGDRREPGAGQHPGPGAHGRARLDARLVAHGRRWGEYHSRLVGHPRQLGQRWHQRDGRQFAHRGLLLDDLPLGHLLLGPARLGRAGRGRHRRGGQLGLGGRF